MGLVTNSFLFNCCFLRSLRSIILPVRTSLVPRRKYFLLTTHPQLSLIPHYPLLQCGNTEAPKVASTRSASSREERGQPMILWAKTLTLWSAVLSATVQLASRTQVQ
uniref:Uncharacterized protein n=1 Tax=Naja naja TaxID=35670 RepID=A0A8C6YB95_NAJNA